MADERPDYVPTSWVRTGGGLNRWTAARPQRVVGFFVVMLIVALGLVVWAASDPHWFFGSPRGWVALAAVVAVVVQAAIYVPRALRAARRG